MTTYSNGNKIVYEIKHYDLNIIYDNIAIFGSCEEVSF